LSWERGTLSLSRRPRRGSDTAAGDSAGHDVLRNRMRSYWIDHNGGDEIDWMRTPLA